MALLILKIVQNGKQFSVTLTAPAGAVKFRFEVRTYKGTTDGGAVYYDDMEISEVK